MTVGIVGLGLIGGSMAKSLKRYTSHRVLGCDTDSEALTMAEVYGAVDGVLTDETLGECDVVLLAVSPKAALAYAKEKAELFSKNAILVDLCGVKKAVCDELAPLAREKGFRYVGCHPMAGKECSGFQSSDSSLFFGASMILTPDSHTDMATLETLKELFTRVGFGTLTFSTAEEHDRIIALTSQLAHLVSGAYVKSPSAQSQRGFSAGSFRDMTRVARLDERMWTELFSMNRDNLISELEILMCNLEAYLEALKTEDDERLCELLREGREKKETAGGR